MSEEINSTKSGLPHDKLIKSALAGLVLPPEEMQQRLAAADEKIREDIQAEMDTINWFFTAILYWREHGMLEAVNDYYEANRVDK